MAVTLAAGAMVVATPRETAPALHPDSPHGPPHAEDVAILEQVQAWFDPATGAALESGPLHRKVRSHRESFELFIGASDDDAIRGRMRSVPFSRLILAAADRQSLDPLLVAAVVQTESSFNKEAVSPRGALGLMQMMPTTAEQLGVADVLHPTQNLNAGVNYLAYLLRRFDRDLVKALAGYNAGPGAVDRFGGLPPFRETRDFVNTVLHVYVRHHRAAWKAVNPSGLDFVVLAGR